MRATLVDLHSVVAAASLVALVESPAAADVVELVVAAQHSQGGIEQPELVAVQHLHQFALQ